MTVVNAIRTSEASWLITDGAYLDRDSGVLRAIGVKQFIMPNVPCAIAVRGEAQMMMIIAAVLVELGSTFDDLRRRVNNELKSEISKLLSGSLGFDLVVAGWSASKGRADTFALSSCFGRLPIPWKVYDLGDVILLPDTIMFRELSAGAFANDPVAYAREILKAQRCEEVQAPGFENIKCSAGGFGQLTTITADSIETKVICHWPDVLGEPLTGRPPVARVQVRRE